MRRWIRNLVGGAGAVTAIASLLVGAAPAGAIVPGTNGPIVFESSRDGNNEIYKMNPDGSAQTRLTNAFSNEVFPAWSPDGTRITYSSDVAEISNLDVYVMYADGSGATRLTNAPGEDRGTSWTSDGEKIVFHSARDRDATHTFDVFIMNADGSDQTKLFTNGSAAYVCGDSENGTIVFNSSGDPLGTNPGGDFEIFTMDIDGTNVFQVTDNTVIDSGPKWSPDCSHISYNSLDTTSLDIWRIDADGSNPVNLTNAPGVFDAFSAWSPDGERIVFSSNRDGNFEVYTMDSDDGANVVRLTFTAGAELRSDWGVPARVEIDDTVRGNADRARLTGTFTCPAGEVFLIQVTLTQDATSGSGRARGTCTGEPQMISVGINRTSGPGFAPGPAQACLTATSAEGRTVSDEIQLCNDVTLTP